MKKQESVALLAAGRVSTSFLQRMPVMLGRLGPVASTSLRLASRICNILRAGDPVEDLAPVQRCGTVLISGPNPQVFVDRAIASGLDWTGAVFLVVEPHLGSEVLAGLARAGAHTGSLAPVEGFDSLWYVVEGDNRAVAVARQLAENEDARTLRIEQFRKPVYNAGLSVARDLALPMVAACAESLRASGLSPLAALDITERGFQRTLRAYRRGGRKSWEGPLPRKEAASIRSNLEGLEAANPALAAYYAGSAAGALRLFKHDSGWLEAARPAERKKVALAAAASA
jgi:predicted short-subunit dehydrogenase-like oxidoreductase (DUF2520 family)